MKKILQLSFILMFCFTAQGQQNFWSSTVAKKIETLNKHQRTANLNSFESYKLDLSAMKRTLAKSSAKTTITFPTGDNTFEDFEIIEHSVFQSKLQAKHPNLRAYKGVSVQNPSTVIYLSTGPQHGLSAMVLSNTSSTYYIDAYTKDNSIFAGYNRRGLPANEQHFECEVLGTDTVSDIQSAAPERNANDGILRTYRLALASTGEYSQFHLDAAGIPITDITTPDSEKKAVVLEEMMRSMVRVNGIYERDVAVTMVIVDNNERIIYLNRATDPYTNEDGVSMLFTNQVACDNEIGSENYDIGHVYSTGGGGVAFLGVPCDDANKAGGVTGLPMPTGDPFWVDFVAHEMGHQFGANHTQNNDCQRNGPTAMEPGSASTILGYAGICTPNVQNNSDPHFHAISIDEMWNYVNTQNCEVQTPTNNLPPLVSAPQDFNIPASTPFDLIAVATDPDTDDTMLSYCWEQIDNEIGEVMPPVPTNTQGPMFRSDPPILSNIRSMPNLATVLSGATANTWEVVPSVARDMEFRVTVRDNELNGGATASDDVIVTVVETAGPFVITSQNTATTWEPSSTQTITWDVNNTDVAPINATNVNILFSDNGGESFDFALATNVANDGSEEITVPNLLTENGRVKIVPTNNSFYDINDSDIVVDGVLNVNDVLDTNAITFYPNPSNGIVRFNMNGVTENVTLKLFNLQGRQIKTSEFNEKGSIDRALNFSAIPSGIYFIKISSGAFQTTKKLVFN